MRKLPLLIRTTAWILLALLTTDSLFAQPSLPPGTLVSGTITTAAGQPVEGATVTEKGERNGVSSAADGSFSIRLKSSGRELVITSIGYTTQELKIRGTAPLIIQLEESANSLDGVVVVGYGRAKKVDLTGAVASISSKELQNRPVTSVGQALQGQVANLNISPGTSGGAPGAMPAINVRGYTGFGVSAAPLVVIDGVPGGDINAVNPSDIDAITVLKDAASSAIYGSSAPYGVLLISTKQGKKNQKTRVSYSDNFALAQVINLPKMINSLDFANIYNEAFVNSGRAPWFNDETIQRIKDYQDGSLKQETIKDPNNDDWYGSGIGYFTGTGPNTGNGNNDWFKIYFRPWSFSQQHNIGVSGGGPNSTYYLGGGYLNKEGMYNFMSDTYKRYNLRANLSTAISRLLTLNFRSAFSREQSNTPATYADATGGNYMHQIARKLPTTPVKNPDGFYSDYSNINLFTQGGRDTYTDDKSLMTGELVFTPLAGLNITGNVTYDGRNYAEQNFNKVVYSVLPSGNKVVEFQTNPNNSLQESSLRQDHYVLNLYASYAKTIHSHAFEVLGGFIKDYKVIKSMNAGNSQLYSNDIPSLNLTYNSSPSVGDNDMRLAIEGFFGRLKYNYKEKFLVEFNGRYDASSRFLANSRWNLYPSVSAGYVLSKESYWKPLSAVVNTFKIRGSYGSLGDQWGDNPKQDNFYPFYPGLGTTAPTASNWIFNDGREAYVTPAGLVNPLLTWATIQTLDGGFDAEFFNRRLSASLDLYSRTAKNFVGPSQSLPAVLGTAVPMANNAEMRTNGFEFSLGWNDQIGKLSYFVRAVLSNYRSTVLTYPNPTQLLSDWYNGMTMGEIWGYKTAGLYQSADDVQKSPSQQKIFGGNWTPGDVHYQDLNGDGSVDFGNNTVSNPGDRRVIGNSTPQYAYGFSFGGSLHGFDLSVFLQGVAKRDAWIGSNMYWGIIGGEWQSTLMVQNLDRYTASTPNGFFPKYYMTGEMSKNMQVQTRYLQNAAYMRVKNVQIGYNIPLAAISRYGLSNIRIYFSGDNLLTVTKLQKSIDPELAVGDGKIYPLQRTYSFGLNVTF